MAKQTLYEILEIKPKATEAEIKSAYRELAKKYHPDLNHTAEAAKKFKEIHQAYAVLSNIFERKIYDESLKSHKLPKDVFTPPRPTYTQTTREPTEEERKKAEEIQKYRRFLIRQAILKVIFNALIVLLGGYALISLTQMLVLKKLAIDLISWQQGSGMLAGFLLGLIWSIDHYFKIETFISKPKNRMLFRHFRTATFALAFTYLFVFVWSHLTQFTLKENPFLTAGMLILVFWITTTFASDGEMRSRFSKGNVIEIMILFWHNFLMGLGGTLLGLLVGIIFYLLDQTIELIYFSALVGFIFGILIGSVAPQDLNIITQKINQVTRSMIYILLILLVFVGGVGVGFLLR